MVSKTRSAKKAVAPSGHGRAPDAIANVNASERETEPHIEGTGADGVETEIGSPARRCPATKFRAPKKKKKTSPVWNHFTDLLVEEKEGDILIKKPECNYCDEVLSAPSNQESSSRMAGGGEREEERRVRLSVRERERGALGGLLGLAVGATNGLQAAQM